MSIVMTKSVGGGTVDNTVVGEDVSGEKNNSNRTFTTVSAYKSGTLKVNYNGQLFKSGYDYEELTSRSFKFVYVKPYNDDVIYIDYVLL